MVVCRHRTAHRALVAAIREELGDISDELDRLSVRRTRSAMEGSTTLPTEDQLQLVDKAWDETPALIGQLNAVISSQMPALNRSLDDAHIRADPGELVEIPTRWGR